MRMTDRSERLSGHGTIDPGRSQRENDTRSATDSVEEPRGDARSQAEHPWEGSERLNDQFTVTDVIRTLPLLESLMQLQRLVSQFEETRGGMQSVIDRYSEDLAGIRGSLISIKGRLPEGTPARLYEIFEAKIEQAESMQSDQIQQGVRQDEWLESKKAAIHAKTASLLAICQIAIDDVVEDIGPLFTLPSTDQVNTKEVLLRHCREWNDKHKAHANAMYPLDAIRGPSAAQLASIERIEAEIEETRREIEKMGSARRYEPEYQAAVQRRKTLYDDLEKSLAAQDPATWGNDTERNDGAGPSQDDDVSNTGPPAEDQPSVPPMAGSSRGRGKRGGRRGRGRGRGRGGRSGVAQDTGTSSSLKPINSGVRGGKGQPRGRRGTSSAPKGHRATSIIDLGNILLGKLRSR